ncbi:MAG: leucine--tRNA ligase [Clostridiales bacterium]|nr:leucine--tRNA ligase [Clostridiales bacterium]
MMNHNEIERKWQGIWNDTGINTFNDKAKGDKHYVLEMLPYPSGAKLHMGHWYNYGIADSYARFMRMNGYNVFQPMGFDAFGLPAENYAIKTGVHPKDSTDVNIATMERQLKDMGTMVDWQHEFRTCAPDYYKWTQWLFLQLYKNGLAYQKKAPVNFCPSCQTVIANEQVVDGKCERCKTEVVRKEMTQWFFKITDYAEKLLSGIDALDWPEKTKTMQRNWIGKSVGGEVTFDLVKPIGDVKSITVFTTRADTLFGVTYVVLAPEHPYVSVIVTDGQRAAVDAYVAQAAKQSEIERTSTSKDKTGVFTGAYCINPINGEKVPVLVADYCLSTYGTGAVMGVAAHDTRDYAFALKNDMPIKRVISGKNGNDDLPFTDYGVMTNSGEFDGLPSDKGKIAVLEKLEKLGHGGRKTNYRMRDWSVSRQRYWGAPIPMIYCEHCGAVPVPEKDLPVTLPYDVNFTPDGKSPLARCEEFTKTVCPVCGKPARRESDTLDTFVCSSWYYLRYPDAHNDKAPFDKKTVNKMLPVDCYVGGAEHACTHLLYSRFITKVLHDLGYLDFDEPFKRLVHQGVILGPDGYRMSKTRGNVISADPLIEKYGSDALRLYLMFGFDYTEGGPWSDGGITSCAKFMDRIERLAEEVKNEKASEAGGALDYELNYCIKEVKKDIPEFGFNTAVARLMELVNAMYKYRTSAEYNPAYLKHVLEVTVRLMAPLAPHFCEELNQMLGGKKSVFLESYPICDESKLVKSSTEYAVQINSKIRCKVVLPQGLDRAAIEKAALQTAEVKEVLNGATPVKVIVIPERLINLIVK